MPANRPAERTRTARVRRLLLPLLLLTLAGCGSAPVAPAFSLTNQFGQPFQLQQLRGRPVLLTFLYTHCPDTCPLYLSHISAALNTQGQAGDEAPQVVVVTVDPDRDTVDALRRYSSSWPNGWLFLTGRYQQVAAVWKDYGIFVEKAPMDHSSDVHDDYGINHTARLLILDRNGSIENQLSGDWEASALVSVLTASPVQRFLYGPLSALAGVGGLLRKCGQFATANPGLFFSLVGLVMLPGLLLGAFLLKTFLGPEQA